jgi:hypothetical protein
MTAQPVSPDLARAAWSATEPLHIAVYFTPERLPIYTDAGLEPQVMGYFATRSAALGPVGPETVAATFYNFSPELIRSVIPKAWAAAPPAAVLAARLRAADTALRGALGEAVASPEMAEAARLARAAAEEAAGRPHGRPLFAAHSGLPWPEEDHLVLWHAATLLREFRGDGHIAALLRADLGPVEALVTHAAAGTYRASSLRRSRGWSEEAWDAGAAALAERGLVAVDAEGGLSLTEEGARVRAEIEAETDALAAPPYAAIGADGCARLIELATPFAEAVKAAGILPGTRRR